MEIWPFRVECNHPRVSAVSGSGDTGLQSFFIFYAILLVSHQSDFRLNTPLATVLLSYCVSTYCVTTVLLLYNALHCCTVMHCTTLCSYCTTLYYAVVLNCTLLYCTVIALHCTTLRYYTILYYNVLHCTALKCAALHCTALHYAHCTALK